MFSLHDTVGWEAGEIRESPGAPRPSTEPLRPPVEPLANQHQVADNGAWRYDGKSYRGPLVAPDRQARPRQAGGPPHRALAQPPAPPPSARGEGTCPGKYLSCARGTYVPRFCVPTRLLTRARSGNAAAAQLYSRIAATLKRGNVSRNISNRIL